MALLDEIIARGQAYPDKVAIADTTGRVVTYGNLTVSDIPDVPDANGNYTVKTGGTGGVQKLFVLTDAQMQTVVRRFSFVKGPYLPQCSCVFFPHPPDPGIRASMKLFLLWKGITVLFDSAFGDVNDVVALCTKYKADGAALTVKPRQNLPIISRYRFKHIAIGGSHLTRPRLKEISQFCDTLYYNYSTNETGGPVSGAFYEDLTGQPGCVGKVYPDIQVKIDAQGNLAIKGPGMPTGYTDSSYDDAFQDGWFFPGDTGSFDADGNLIVNERYLPSVDSTLGRAAIIDGNGSIVGIIMADPDKDSSSLGVLVPPPPEYAYPGSHVYDFATRRFERVI